MEVHLGSIWRLTLVLRNGVQYNLVSISPESCEAKMFAQGHVQRKYGTWVKFQASTILYLPGPRLDTVLRQ